MCSTLSSCRLYSWMRLIWLSKIVSGSTAGPPEALSQSTNRVFADAFRDQELGPERGVVRERREAAQLARGP